LLIHHFDRDVFFSEKTCGLSNQWKKTADAGYSDTYFYFIHSPPKDMKIMSEFGTMQSETLVTRAETQRRREQKIRSTKSETRNNFQITKIGKIPNKLPSDSVSCIFPIV
jgi:hypothetical protein